MTLYGTCPECGRRIGVRRERVVGGAWRFLITLHKSQDATCPGWRQDADARVPVTRSRD